MGEAQSESESEGGSKTHTLLIRRNWDGRGRGKDGVSSLSVLRKLGYLGPSNVSESSSNDVGMSLSLSNRCAGQTAPNDDSNVEPTEPTHHKPNSNDYSSYKNGHTDVDTRTKTMYWIDPHLNAYQNLHENPPSHENAEQDTQNNLPLTNILHPPLSHSFSEAGYLIMELTNYLHSQSRPTIHEGRADFIRTSRRSIEVFRSYLSRVRWL
ncbi:hypothetical protein D9758_015220 [Tetrapyrgos nigripes]|uniref:Uncharacterized protein n=1 Tax=Tetrapyrgos nigripes TaxID=182062 RepID=A0A8H5FNB6_9AGAR|nr:hypothetical protein D9758_015220 [Tetrapyrgos nigripes]